MKIIVLVLLLVALAGCSGVVHSTVDEARAGHVGDRVDIQNTVIRSVHYDEDSSVYAFTIPVETVSLMKPWIVVMVPVWDINFEPKAGDAVRVTGELVEGAGGWPVIEAGNVERAN